MSEAIQKVREALRAIIDTLDAEEMGEGPPASEHVAHWQKLHDDGTAALAALDAETEVKIKPLEWTRNLHGITQWAETDFGPYVVDPTRAKPMRFMWGNPLGEWSTVDTEATAKAAAQADYERRIRSALVTPEARS